MLTRLAPSRSSLSSLRTSSSLILLNWLLRLRQVFVNFALQLADCFLYMHQGADGRVGLSVAYAQLGLGHFKFGFPLVNSFHFLLSVWLLPQRVNLPNHIEPLPIQTYPHSSALPMCAVVMLLQFFVLKHRLCAYQVHVV